MKNFNLCLLILGGSCLLLLSGCQKSIFNLFPKEPRPFQEKAFNSQQWKEGDYQTRGEMAEDLRGIISKPNAEWKKSADEVRQILGEPDVITQADCCESGRTFSPGKVELWLYNLEIAEDHGFRMKKDDRERKIIPQAFKLYFRQNSSHGFVTVIGERRGDHDRVMPVVGTLIKN